MASKGYTSEAGVNGANVTNTDTGSGDVFQTATGGTGGVCKYDTTHAAHGTTAIRYNTGVTSTSAYTEWSSISYAVMKFRVNAYLTSAAVTSILVRGMGSGSQKFRITLESDGKLHVRDAANGGLATSTTTFPLNAYASVRGEVTAGASAAWNIRLYSSPDSTTATETLSGSAGNFTAGNFDACRFGVASNFASVVDYWLDDHAIDDTTSPGPAQITITLSGIAVPVGIGSAAIADGSLAVSPSGIAVPRGIGTVSLANSGLAVAPTGLAVPVGLGTPTLAVPGLAVAPSGLAVPLAVGAPTVVSPGLAVAPAGLAVPLALGAAVAADGSMAAAPVGLAVGVGAGTPATAGGAMTMAPAGIAVPVAVGHPTAAPISRYVTRPDTGLVTRPNTGTVTRPDTGVVTRP